MTRTRLRGRDSRDVSSSLSRPIVLENLIWERYFEKYTFRHSRIHSIRFLSRWVLSVLDNSRSHDNGESGGEEKRTRRESGLERGSWSNVEELRCLRMNERKRMGPKATERLCSFSVGSSANGAQGRAPRERERVFKKIRYLTFSRSKRARNFANILPLFSSEVQMPRVERKSIANRFSRRNRGIRLRLSSIFRRCTNDNWRIFDTFAKFVS